MEHQRREFLKSFASMGAVGASTLAAVACGRAGAPQNEAPTAGGANQTATSLHGRGPTWICPPAGAISWPMPGCREISISASKNISGSRAT